MTGFEVDPTALKAASPKFSSAGDKLGTAWETLRNALDAEGECWGNDEAGQKFAQGYKPAADLARQAFPQLVEGVHSIRTGLDASADEWDAVDKGAAQTFGGQG